MTAEAAIDGGDGPDQAFRPGARAPGPLVAPAPQCEPSDPGRPPLPRRSARHPAATPCRTVGAHIGPVDTAVIAHTESTLRTILEVVDGRRPVSQLDGYLTEPAIAALTAYCRARPRPTSVTVSRIHRVRVQWMSCGAAEVFGTYARGDRLLAFAGRLERGGRRPAGTPASTPSTLCAARPARRMRPRPAPDWIVTALRLG